MPIDESIVEFFRELFGDTVAKTLIGLGATLGLIHAVWRLFMYSPHVWRWIQAGTKPRVVFSSTKNNDKDDSEIDPNNWEKGDTDRWCLMRGQRQGDFLRLIFKRPLTLTIHQVSVHSGRKYGMPVKGMMEVWRAEKEAWDTADGKVQEWHEVTVYKIDKPLQVHGIGFRIVEPRKEPPGEQFPSPAWSISKVVIKASRWWFIRRNLVLPWE